MKRGNSNKLKNSSKLRPGSRAVFAPLQSVRNSWNSPGSLRVVIGTLFSPRVSERNFVKWFRHFELLLIWFDDHSKLRTKTALLEGKKSSLCLLNCIEWCHAISVISSESWTLVVNNKLASIKFTRVEGTTFKHISVYTQSNFLSIFTLLDSFRKMCAVFLLFYSGSFVF